MTHVQYVNCDKMWRIIGISFWSLVTIGLLFALNYVISYHLANGFEDCYDVNPPDHWMSCRTDFAYELGIGTQFFSVIIGNIMNFVIMFYYINSKNKWIKFVCVKPNPKKVE